MKHTLENLAIGQTDSTSVPKIYAKHASPFHPKRRSDSTKNSFQDIARLPDNALDSLGEIARQCFAKLAIPTQSFLQLLVLLDSRTIAILHTTFRLTVRLISDVNFAGKWDSALKGKSALGAHVAPAAGIDLAHREGQYVIHFLWDMRKFYDSIKAHLLIPQLVVKRVPDCNSGIWHFDTRIAEMSPSGQRFQRRHHWLCLQHFGRLSPKLLVGRGFVV